MAHRLSNFRFADDTPEVQAALRSQGVPVNLPSGQQSTFSSTFELPD